ncbi:MAG: DUF268 domain-containing protein [Bacteroidia bacterium]
MLGDRDVEYSFAIKHIPKAGDKVLDFGSGGSFIPLVLAQFFNEVIAMDKLAIHSPWNHPRIKEVQADILDDSISYPEYFDAITNISTIEHIGLAGRFDNARHVPDGDLIAMKKLKDWLKPNGIHILTIPVGRDTVYMPYHRIYGEKRLPLLLEGYRVIHEEYWAKPNKDNKWYLVDKTYALNYETDAGSPTATHNIYALGCFVLQK